MRRLFVVLSISVALSGCIAGVLNPSDDDESETPNITDSTVVTPSVPSVPGGDNGSSSGGENAPTEGDDAWQDDGGIIL